MTPPAFNRWAHCAARPVVPLFSRVGRLRGGVRGRDGDELETLSTGGNHDMRNQVEGISNG